MELNGTWKLHDFAPGEGSAAGAHRPDFADAGWIPVSVPGDVHTALIAAGRIEDPFWGMNEAACAWMEEREWWYRLTFQPSDQAVRIDAAEGQLRLVFHGLDTFAHVYLNGEKLGEHANMFREAVFDVTGRIRPGEANTVAVCFDPPLQRVAGREYPPGMWGRNPERVWMRKAQFGYGWDWGPRLPTIGIWREVELQAHRRARIEAVYFRTEVIDKEEDWAQVAVTVDVARLGSYTGRLTARVALSQATQTAETRPVSIGTLALDGERGTLRMGVDEPALWWTNGLGEPALYDLSIRLDDADGDALDVHRERVGIRTIQLDQSPDTDEPGARFFRFVLNGVPVFVKGADWIPAHTFVGAVDRARYRMLLERARDANMNMLRIWGGGVYEKPDFYRLCDELGLLIWQDFMFACAAYPEDDAFAAEVEREIRAVVRRLRNHPCLALWCGNNENQWIDDMVFWAQYPERVVPGARYYHEIIPRIVAEMDPSRPYWPGSPYGGNDFNSMEDGDRHNWCVWHGQGDSRRFGEQPTHDFSPEGVTFTRYANDRGRFISEFGMHAAPALETLRRNVPADGLAYNSEQMLHRNKDNPKNKGDNLMLSCTGLPKDLNEYIDFSMIAQAEGLKFGVEHFRRRKPHCSGALFWQLNDTWPGLSWSVLDYYGFGKAGYYYARRFYAPVIASFKAEPDGGVSLWIVNDTLEPFEDEARLRYATFDGTTLFTETVPVRVDANASAKVYALPADRLAPGDPARSYLSVVSAAVRFPDNRHFFVAIKDLQRPTPRLDVQVQQVDEGRFRVTAGTDVYAFFIKIETPYEHTHFDDNYFDLEPGARRTITLRNAVQPLTAADINVSCR